MIRLLSWNVAWQSTATPAERIHALAEHGPHIVALQEVRRIDASAFDQALGALGLRAPSEKLHPERGHGLLLASRWPLERLAPTRFDVPDDEAGFHRKPAGTGRIAVRMLSAVVRHPKTPFEVHVVHVPPGSSAGWRKIDTLRAVRKRLARASALPRVLCGDFNEPRSETPELTSWANHNKHARSNPKRWAAAVEGVLRGLERFDLTDVFRVLRQGELGELWSARITGGARRRYDHVLASKVLHPKRAEYLHEVDSLDASDHTPVLVELSPGG